MNLKTLLTFATVTASTAVLAEVVSTTTLCRIKVDSGTKNTIVALPLIKVGGTKQTIPVSEFVMTDNLAVGDSILVMNSTGKTQAAVWTLKEDASTHVKSWQPGTVVEGTDSTTAPAASTAAQARGSAIWLTREDPAKPFYLYGQVSEESVEVPTIFTATSGEGDVVVPAYTFIGNPDPKDVKLNALDWQNCGEKDQIVWGLAGGLNVNIYTRKDSQWGYYKTETVEKDGIKASTTKWEADITLPAGQGFWYVSATVGGTAPSFSWASTGGNEND